MAERAGRVVAHHRFDRGVRRVDRACDRRAVVRHPDDDEQVRAGRVGDPRDRARERHGVAVDRRGRGGLATHPLRAFDRPAEVLVGVARRAHGQPDRPRLAGGDRLEALVAGGVEQRRRRQDPEQRHAREDAAALLGHEHRVEGVQAGAAVVLGDQQSRPARLDGERPEVGRAGGVLEGGAGGGHRSRARERAARGLAQQFLLVGQGEVHRTMLRRGRLALPAAQLAERDALVQARLRRQPEHALADRVAQDLLGPARRLQPRQERDHVRPLLAVLERVGAHRVGDELARRDRRVHERDLRETGLRAGDLAALERGQGPVAAELHRDEVGGDLAEAAADVGVAPRGRVGGERLREAALLVAEALGAEADREALEHERRQRGPPAVVDLADDGVLLQAHVVEEDLVELGLARDLPQAADGHAGRVHRHDEHRQALVLGDVGVGAGEQQPERGELGVRRPHLLPAEAPRAVLLAPRAGLDPGEVRARGGLGEQLAPDLVAVQHRAEVARLLGVGPVADERRAEHAHADRVEDPGHAGGRDLLVDDDVLDRPEAPAAVLGRPRDAGEAALGQRALPAAPRGDVRAVLVAAARGRRLGAVLGQPGAHGLAVAGLLRAVAQVHFPSSSGRLTSRSGHATDAVPSGASALATVDAWGMRVAIVRVWRSGSGS